MEIKLFYFDKETSQILTKMCKYNFDLKQSMVDKSFDFDLDKMLIEMLEEIYKTMNIFSSEIFTNTKEEQTLYFKEESVCRLFIPFLKSGKKILLPEDIVKKINCSLDEVSGNLDMIENNISKLKNVEEKIVGNTKRIRRNSSLSKYMNYESYTILEKYIKLVELKRLIGVVTCDFYEELTDRINKLFKIKLDIILGSTKKDLILQNLISILTKDCNDSFFDLNFLGNIKEYHVCKTDPDFIERVINIIMEESELIEKLE
jgi:hypothetical protein